MTSPADGLLSVDDPVLLAAVVETVTKILNNHMQPSAWELIRRVESDRGPKARWVIAEALARVAADGKVTGATRVYTTAMLKSADFASAIRGKERPGKEIESSIDQLLQSSSAYRSSEAFRGMVAFMANFRDYAPFNNMLVRLQNPSCSLYASCKDWDTRFGRRLKEDARPMLILAPMHPVMLVYDLDQTEGPPVPAELQSFATFKGEFDPYRLQRTVKNALVRDRIRIDFKPLSSTNAGFATIAGGQDGSKMRIAIHNDLDATSSFGVLCHELAHIYLGHLGGDPDGWWPARGNLDRRTMEVEAEAVAYITTRRVGLSGSSPAYVSRYMNDAALERLSLDLVAKVAGRIEEMSSRVMTFRRPPGGKRGGSNG